MKRPVFPIIVTIITKRSSASFVRTILCRSCKVRFCHFIQFNCNAAFIQFNCNVAEQLTHWNYFYFNHIVMYYDDCFLCFFLPSKCFLLLFFLWCVYVLRCFVCLVILMSCTFDTTFKELVASSKTLRLSSR